MNAIFFLCANVNEIKIRIFERLKEQVSKVENVDLYIAIDEENKGEIDRVNHDKIVFFNYHKYKQYNLYRIRKDRRAKITYIGNTIYPFIDFCINHLQYDRYMFYEDDMIYTGDISKLFNQCEGYDIVLQQEIKPAEAHWPWIMQEYNKLATGYFYSNTYNAMTNLYIVSKDCALFLHNRLLQKEWFAHHELIMATEIVSNDKKWKCFSGNNAVFIYDYELGNYLSTEQVQKDTFYHPVKWPEQYENIMNCIE